MRAWPLNDDATRANNNTFGSRGIATFYFCLLNIMQRIPGCPSCTGVLCETTQRHGRFPWAVLWSCPTCHGLLYCCDRSCGPKSGQVTAIVSDHQLNRHHRRFHKKPRWVSEVDYPALLEDDHLSSDALDADEPPSYPIPTEAFHIFRVRLPTKRFFEDLQNDSLEVAVQGLVARSCYLDSRVRMPAEKGLDVADMILFFRIARLVFQLGPKHQHLLAGVLAGFETRYLPPSITSTQHSHGVQLPTTHKAFTAKLLNQTNTNSLTSIIPIPPTVVLSGKHAYVSIPALVAYDLGLANANVDPPYNAKFDRLVNSEHGKALFHRAKGQLTAEGATINGTHADYVPLVALFMMWFDGWDPNASSKGNRSPVWSGSLTLVLINLQGCVVSVATYPFAAGPGKADHNVIFEQILLDVRALQAPIDDCVNARRWYYSRAASTMALVYGELFCIWQDQPGRRQETNLLNGNSLNHAVFGTSCYVKQLQTPIAACSWCRQATMQYLDSGNFQTALLTGCQHCTNWRFPEDPKSSLYRRKISEKFPADAVAGQEFNLGGGRIETTLLIRAWHEACAGLTTARWSEGTAEIYLKTLCVNKSTIKTVQQQCRNHRLWQAIGAKPEEYPEATKADCRRRFAANPHAFAVPQPPAAWQLAALALHPETVMHLSGGVQKAVAKFVHRYATSQGHGPALITRLAFPIELIHKYCRVQYLPLAAYKTDKFGGWVMENYKSLCKLAPWLYHCFEDRAFQKPTPFVTPTKLRSKWTVVENKAYLRSRGFPTPSSMNAAEAREAVHALFALPGGPPDAVVRVASTVDPRDMRRLWWSCSMMFKDLMRVDHDTATINRTDARVRAFLSAIEALDAQLHPTREMPLYLAKYNFPSLLRAVSHLQPFGNIRDLHEGGIEGEAMVKVLRPLLPKGLKDKFAQHLLQKAFRDTTVDRLLVNLDCRDDLNTAPSAPFVECLPPEKNDEVEDSDEDTATSAEDSANDSDDEQHDSDTEKEPDPFGHMRHMLDDGDDPSDDEDEPSIDDAESGTTDGIAPSPLLFRKYNTLAKVESYFTLGVPISVVLTNQRGRQRIGVIVSTCNQWWLQPVQIGQVQLDDDLGFTYFQVTLYPHEDQIRVRTKPDGENPTYHIELLNYATLLPALWLEPPFPYALVTMEGDHLDALYNIV
jgi:hypothetical protein